MPSSINVSWLTCAKCAVRDVRMLNIRSVPTRVDNLDSPNIVFPKITKIRTETTPNVYSYIVVPYIVPNVVADMGLHVCVPCRS